jgi:hypothetical protein
VQYLLDDISTNVLRIFNIASQFMNKPFSAVIVDSIKNVAWFSTSAIAQITREGTWLLCDSFDNIQHYITEMLFSFVDQNDNRGSLVHILGLRFSVKASS